MRQTLRAAAAAALVAVGIGAPAAAQTEASREQQLEQAQETIDTSRFKKDPPYTIGLSAGYLTNSWVVFAQRSTSPAEGTIWPSSRRDTLD